MNFLEQEEKQTEKVIAFFKETYRRYGKGIFWLHNSDKVESNFLTILEILIDEYYKVDFNFFIGLNRAQKGYPGLMFIKEEILNKSKKNKNENMQYLNLKSIEIFKTKDLSECGVIIDVQKGRIGIFPFNG